MVGITEIGAAISGLKTAFEIAKGLNAVAGSVSLNDAKIALQNAILDAQASLLAAQETHAADLLRVDRLEQEILRLKDWSSERERYELVNIRGGSFAYMLKQHAAGDEPAHWLCANCFNDGRKSILQRKGRPRQGSGEEAYACDTCKGGFTVLGRTQPYYIWATRRDSEG